MNAPVITIYVRHTPGCKRDGDEFTKLCNCRKHLRWQQDGKRYRKQAGTRSWAEAEEIKNLMVNQIAGREFGLPRIGKTLAAACDAFLKGKRVKGIDANTLARYASLTKLFVQFCAGRNVFTVAGVDMELLTEYKATWPERYKSSATRHFVQLVLRVFLNFCHHSGWLPLVPKMDPVKIDQPPTTPLTEAEYERLLSAPKTSPQTRAIMQLMRWSGLAVRDASCLRRDELLYSAQKTYHVVTDRQKTGVHVSVPIPTVVALEILVAARKGGEFLFWNGVSTALNFSKMEGQRISWAFERANIRSDQHMVSHRLRDTFACHLLSKGVPMEEVSKLLGHASIATTEKHYAPWAKGRQDRVNALVTATF
jgi:integrase/recombinase XerD